MRALFTTVLFAAAVFSAAAAGFCAGNISGNIVDIYGSGPRELEIFACGSGASSNTQYYRLENYPDLGQGYYALIGLDHTRTYSLALNDTFHFHPRYRALIPVVNGATTPGSFTVATSYGVFSQNGVSPGSTEIGQTFVATGPCVTKVTVWDAGSTGAVQAAILQGGPGGPQIGPSRGESERGTFRWLNGEVPTVAGQTYYLKYWASPSQTRVYIRSGNPYPQGQAHYNSVAQSGIDLYACVESDDKGLSTMYYRNTNSMSGEWGVEVGQTFRAIGSHLNLVTVWITAVNDPYQDVDFAILAGGPGGAQIGPTKRVRVRNYRPMNQTAACAWEPGEVPVTSGGTYYLKMRAATGDGIYVFTNAANPYPNGACYADGSLKAGSDILATIQGESSLYSSTSLISGYVRDLQGNPIGSALVRTSQFGYRAYSQANGYYQIRATGDTYSLTATKAGYRPQTVAGVAALPGTAPTVNFNLTSVLLDVENPSFETGDLSGWTPYGTYGGVQCGAWYGGVTARTGSCFWGNASNWDYKVGGAYQQVIVTPGHVYDFQAWAQLYWVGPPATATRSRVGIDPTAGTNPAYSGVMWSDWFSWGTESARSGWARLSAKAYAAGSQVTVFLDFAQQPVPDPPGGQWHVNCFDDAGILAASGDRLSDVIQRPDGSSSVLTDVVLTCNKGSFYYVETLDRTAGIRVNGATSASIGDRLAVQGIIGSYATERYIAPAHVSVIQAGAGCPMPFAMTCRSVGGAADGRKPGITGAVGRNNIGLLITAWGRVSSPGSSYFYIDDGSGEQCMVVVPTGMSIPAAGSYVRVTGVSSATGSAGNVRRLIWPRSGADLAVL